MYRADPKCDSCCLFCSSVRRRELFPEPFFPSKTLIFPTFVSFLPATSIFISQSLQERALSRAPFSSGTRPECDLAQVIVCLRSIQKSLAIIDPPNCVSPAEARDFGHSTPAIRDAHGSQRMADEGAGPGGGEGAERAGALDFVIFLPILGAGGAGRRAPAAGGQAVGGPGASARTGTGPQAVSSAGGMSSSVILISRRKPWRRARRARNAQRNPSSNRIFRWTAR